MLTPSEIADRLGVDAPPGLRSWIRANRAAVEAAVVVALRRATLVPAPSVNGRDVHVDLLRGMHATLKTHHGKPALWEAAGRGLVRRLSDPELRAATARSRSMTAAREDELAANASGQFAVAGALRELLVEEFRRRRLN